METGIVVAFAGNKPPTGWEFCHGQSVSKNDPKYVALFQVIGTIHGGDANPNFSLPDYRGIFLRGVSGASNRDPDKDQRSAPGGNNTGNSGNSVGSVQQGQFQRHGHAVGPLHIGHSNLGNGAPWRITSEDGPSWNNTDVQQSTDQQGGNETRPINAYVHYIIKL